MAQFTPLGGGIDNITKQTSSDPTPKANELWAQIVGRSVTQYDELPTGVTEDTTVSHSLHANTVTSVHASNGVVYSASDDSTVIAVDATDGSELWSHSLHTYDVNSVHASNGVVYSGGNDDTVKAVDATDGTELWSHNLHVSNIVYSVHAPNGVVYSGSQDTVKAADANDGTQIWSHSLHSDALNSLHPSTGGVCSAVYQT